MGWVLFPLIGLAAMAALLALGLPRRLWQMAGAALMLGAAGYVLQGRPTLAASPARPVARAAADDAALIELRGRMLGRFTADDAYLLAADALSRSGDPRGAARLLVAGTRAMPRSVALWTALGGALAASDNDTLSPPAAFAFDRAAALAPRHPAPAFFLGAAQVRAGDIEGARVSWHRALALTPPGISYRADIAERVALIDRYATMLGR